MVRLEDFPLVMPVAEWIWGSSPKSDVVTPEICLDNFGLTKDCFSQLLTKALGVAIILGACVNKTPVMANLYKSKSAAGFSRMSVYSETMVFANAAAYGILKSHPVTSYGENLSLFLQNAALIGLLWTYSNTPSSERMQLLGTTLLYLFLVFGCLPEKDQYLLQASNGLIQLYSKGIQVWETYKVQHTGAQSFITNSLNLIGGLARIFTTINETGDMAVVMGILLGVALNGIIFAQYFVYKSNTEKFLKELSEERKDETEKKKK